MTFKRFGRTPLKQKWEVGLIVEGAMLDMSFDMINDEIAQEAILAHTEIAQLSSLEKTYGDHQ